MNTDYNDIIKAAAEGGKKPLWYQEKGVPRFAPFSPDLVSDIYADEAALVEIKCQSCSTSFDVAFTSSSISQIINALKKDSDEDVIQIMRGSYIAIAIEMGLIDYGDPPNTACCTAGPTMSSVPVRVKEYWSRHDKKYTENGIVKNIAEYCRWKRNPRYEIVFP